ncbi:transposase [Vagococcus elongatus]|uniref:transposase n=1 Tax=Vagococcus elongatus TaxID=180344 RepID=UPI0014773765
MSLWFRKKLYTLKKHQQGIEKAFHLPYSNGVTERIINKIKLVKRGSYGYRNFYNLRDRIHIIKGLVFNKHKKIDREIIPYRLTSCFR